eukprot:TRINITY_DN8510_c0_g1_i8.p1 TRINITY_DN8510_c0_g1~~TRINITY_DN8510_c0_g1_i8.p1  ORF type:complete len:334 (+),score=48.05 TRINITY_DN8510_c0_g1_i8:60-1061(+)
MLEEVSLRDKLKSLDPWKVVKIQIMAHVFLIITGLASSIVFALLLVNKEQLLVSVQSQSGSPSFNQDPSESPVLNNSKVVLACMLVVFLHSTISIISSSVFVAANRCQLVRVDMILSNRVQIAVAGVSTIFTFLVVVLCGVLQKRLEQSLNKDAVPDILVTGLLVYLTMLGASIFIQTALILVLYLGRFHFTQLVEEDEDTGPRVRLEIQAEGSPAVNVQIPSDNTALQQVKTMLTLPGRDRLHSIRSLHAYDPVNTSPGLYAVPLTPFNSETGTWSNEAQKVDESQENAGTKIENDNAENIAKENTSDNENIDEHTKSEDTVYDFTLDVPKN